MAKRQRKIFQRHSPMAGVQVEGQSASHPTHPCHQTQWQKLDEHDYQPAQMIDHGVHSQNPLSPTIRWLSARQSLWQRQWMGMIRTSRQSSWLVYNTNTTTKSNLAEILKIHISHQKIGSFGGVLI